jgi:DNA-directed RNA polymerase specialized sigma24 family protein
MNNKKKYVQAVVGFIIECNEQEDTEIQYNQMLAQLMTNKELKRLVYNLVPQKDKEDAWAEFVLQVAEIKDKIKVLEVWNKKNREFHWFMIRIILNQFKSNTSHFYRQYRRPTFQVDDNSHTIMQIVNDIGANDIPADGYVINEIESHLMQNDNTEEQLTNKQIMDEVKWYVANKLSFYERELYTMYYEEELSHVKISNITSIPATSIGNTIRIVLSKIQQHLRYKGIIKKTNI